MYHLLDIRWRDLIFDDPNFGHREYETLRGYGQPKTANKRDFKKIFETTPQKWLTQKRLELARYQIDEKKRKQVDGYFEAGFENLSHFSYAFKKHFGLAPKRLIEKNCH